MKRISSLKKKNQSGYTMLELLLVLGIIIALAAIMIYAFLSRVNKQSSLQTSVAQVSNIVTAERAAVQQQGAIIIFSSPAEAAPLLTFGLQEQIAQNQKTANPWGGDYEVKDIAGTGQFTVSMDNVPSNVTKGTDYSSFEKLMSRIGEGSGTTDVTCKATGNTISCNFDNQ